MSHSLVELLHRTVKSLPGKDAVVHQGRRVTYAELWENISSIAAYLKSTGIMSGDRVALLMENSPEYISAYYGGLAAGGAVVALNTGTKSRDLVNWLKHSEAKWLCADARHPELEKILESCGDNIHLIVYGADEGRFSAKSTACFSGIFQNKMEMELTNVSENHEKPAAIIYTSGTTGNPKGVVLSHKNLVTNVNSILEYLKLTAEDRILNILPFYYSYGNSVLHTHMAVGGTLILENNMAFPQKILSLMATEKVTGFSGVPSTYALLMSRVKMSDFDLSNMRYMTQAGGAMAPANITRLCEELPHVKFFVMYGQTEATARLAYLPPEKLEQKLGSIGVAIPGVTLEIKDDLGRCTSPGETGEIYASGENIMLGYWKDPDATNKVLENGWLKTGDLAHYDEDGYLYIVGRSSEMIKSGANRISPKEVEEVIAELDEVAEVAVVGVADELMGQLLKAVIVLKPDIIFDRKKILAYCRENLAMYKIPKTIELMKELPKTASGKVKRFMLQ